MAKDLYIPCRIYSDNSVSLLDGPRIVLSDDYQKALEFVGEDAAKEASFVHRYGVLKLVRTYERKVVVVPLEP